MSVDVRAIDAWPRRIHYYPGGTSAREWNFTPSEYVWSGVYWRELGKSGCRVRQMIDIIRKDRLQDGIVETVGRPAGSTKVFGKC